MPKADYIFDWLIEKCCQTDPHYERSNPFRVYSLDKLFYELRRHADLQNPRLVFPTMVMVADKLQCDTFDYYPNMACEVTKYSIKFKNMLIRRIFQDYFG